MLDVASIFINPAYWVIFIAMVIEGPIVTYVATLFALNGALNIWMILLLSILGNVFADLLYYFLGYYFSNLKFVKRLDEKSEGSRFKQQMHKLTHKNLFITILIVKLIPAFGVIGLFYLGKRKSHVNKFLIYNVIICVILSLFFMALAYFGVITLKALDQYMQTYQIYGILITLLIVAIFLLWFFRSKIKTFVLRIILKRE